MNYNQQIAQAGQADNHETLFGTSFVQVRNCNGKRVGEDCACFSKSYAVFALIRRILSAIPFKRRFRPSPVEFIGLDGLAWKSIRRAALTLPHAYKMCRNCVERGSVVGRLFLDVIDHQHGQRALLGF